MRLAISAGPTQRADKIYNSVLFYEALNILKKYVVRSKFIFADS